MREQYRSLLSFALPALLLAMAALTAACGQAAYSSVAGAGSLDAAKPTGRPLTIGIMPAEAAIPVILAHENGYMQEEGAALSIKAFSSPNDRNIAVQAGELDAAIGDMMTAAAFRSNGINVKVTSDISEDFKILSSPNSGIAAMNELAGKTVSLVPHFILEYIMDRFAEQGGFSYEIVEIPSFAGRAEALLSDQVDAVVFTEPQAGMLVSQGAHLLGGSREAGIQGGAIFFSDEAISQRPGDIAAFYRAYNRAIDYMNGTDVSQYIDLLTRYQFPEQIGAYLSGLTGGFDYAGVIDREPFDSVMQWTLDKKLIDKLYAYEELTDFSLLPAAAAGAAPAACSQDSGLR